MTQYPGMGREKGGQLAANIVKARAAERYAKVTHLTDIEAAAHMGLTRGNVRQYRKAHPEARYRSPHVQVMPEIDAGIAEQTSRCSPVPKRAVEVRTLGAITGHITTSRISLPREPWVPS